MNGNLNAQDGLDGFYQQTIDSLIAAAAERDQIAQNHSERVRRYASAIAEELDGISAEEVRNIGYAASLHDIGKVAISSKILNKLGRLTEEEFQVMRAHSVAAVRILEKIDGLHGAIPIIRHHHERYDGEGYPDGLAGEKIPLGARIVSVAETYDILTSDVPWRAALTKEDAIHEIERCSGTQFDPTIVAALRCVINDSESPAP